MQTPLNIHQERQTSTFSYLFLVSFSRYLVPCLFLFPYLDLLVQVDCHLDMLNIRSEVHQLERREREMHHYSNGGRHRIYNMSLFGLPMFPSTLSAGRP
jgi:hypothetical protein